MSRKKPRRHSSPSSPPDVPTGQDAPGEAARPAQSEPKPWEIPIEYNEDPEDFDDTILVGESKLTPTRHKDPSTAFGGKPPLPPPTGTEPEITESSRKGDCAEYVDLSGSMAWFDLSRARKFWFARSDRPDELLYWTVSGKWVLYYAKSIDSVLEDADRRVPTVTPWGQDLPQCRELDGKLAACWFKRNGCTKSDLRLMSWEEGSPVPRVSNLVVFGTDNQGLLRVTIFDAGGGLPDEAHEEARRETRTEVIASLKRKLPGLLPPHVLTDAEKVQVLVEAISIIRQTRFALLPDELEPYAAEPDPVGTSRLDWNWRGPVPKGPEPPPRTKRTRLKKGDAATKIIAALDSLAAKGQWNAPEGAIIARAGVSKSTYYNLKKNDDEVIRYMKKYHDRRLGRGPVRPHDL
jgi:hypothetical protein